MKASQYFLYSKVSTKVNVHLKKNLTPAHAVNYFWTFLCKRVFDPSDHISLIVSRLHLRSRPQGHNILSYAEIT